jgi:chromosome segregation ATPase
VGDSVLDPSGGSSSPKIPILFGAVVGASLYQFYEVRQVRAELESTRDALMDQIAKVHETSTVSSKTNRQSVDSLKSQMDEARRQASILAGQAKLDATKHADELAAKLESAQAQEAAETAKVAASVTAVSGDLSKVKDDANSTKNRVGEVSTDLAGVKTDAAATKAELEKTISDLKSTRGDLGVQSGLIATNGKELAALRALGERNYTEFRLTKEKTPRKVGDVQMRLKAADMKKNRYTIELIADDKLVEKKDKTINEPVQFMLSRATQPFEIVVNEVKKDMISGYLSAPKVQQTRN